jgi:hypothetical protein
MSAKSAIKRALRALGYRMVKIDPLEETIPADYNQSPFLGLLKFKWVEGRRAD